MSQCEKILGVLLDCTCFLKNMYIKLVKNHVKWAILFLWILNLFIYLLDLIKFYIKPIFENVSVVWSPHHIDLIDLIVNVPHDFTKRLPGWYYMNYNGRLFFNSELLKMHRVYNDFIMLYKILYSHVIIYMNSCISVS